MGWQLWEPAIRSLCTFHVAPSSRHFQSLPSLGPLFLLMFRIRIVQVSFDGGGKTLAGFEKWRWPQQPAVGPSLTNLTLQTAPATHMLGLPLGFSL